GRRVIFALAPSASESPVMRQRVWCSASMLFIALSAACSATPVENERHEQTKKDESEERWNDANNPARVDDTFVYEVDALPLSGAAPRLPISGDYWATSEDSINRRWDGEDSMSPAEKFEKAFGKSGVELAVSNDTGIRGQSGRAACSAQSEC